MGLDNLFDEAAKRRAEIARDREEQAQKNEVERKSQTEQKRQNAIRIDQRLRSAHEYLVRTHFPVAKSKGYDIQHEYELTPTVTGQTYSQLHVYMHRGSIVHVFGGRRPSYQADHQLSFEGDEDSGDISIFLHSRIGNTEEQLDHIRSDAELNDAALDAVFESFVKRSLELEDWQRRRAPPR
jgi:hypothetical protein